MPVYWTCSPVLVRWASSAEPWRARTRGRGKFPACGGADYQDLGAATEESFVGASLKARVLVKKAEQVAGGFGEPFDVIFIDPPYAYETAECNQLLSDLAAGSATNENTVIMLERSVRSDDPLPPELANHRKPQLTAKPPSSTSNPRMTTRI